LRFCLSFHKNSSISTKINKAGRTTLASRKLLLVGERLRNAGLFAIALHNLLDLARPERPGRGAGGF
jgi:hypothetical protein